MRFYVHGAGRAGREAWPAQSDDGAVFADHSAATTASDKARLLREQCPPRDVVLVAHSLGAVPAALGLDVPSLSHVVLLEPALYDVARGVVAVEEHIAAMTAARKAADAGDLFGYWQVVAPLMFGRPATDEAWEEDEPLAARFAAVERPWGHGIDATVFGAVPALVVTGAWNDEYEAIGERLAVAGASHVHLTGHRHRPQDHPGFEGLVADFVS
ncbi:hypothetical protein CFI00_06185 [Nocardioides sp. S5]|uniref:alpha/beta fold hydrolase n=1 Tax=Nocardioides sp. S5 TaxID=2017486 RepID=UPI001A8D882D|nr:alpha/beta fold hydrolase [Nocardioides sp. S5]QSR30109.1 hypothetical protein CFI00_06185 [Nocardioides sp. S5]